MNDKMCDCSSMASSSVICLTQPTYISKKDCSSFAEIKHSIEQKFQAKSNCFSTEKPQKNIRKILLNNNVYSNKSNSISKRPIKQIFLKSCLYLRFSLIIFQLSFTLVRSGNNLYEKYI